MQTSGPRMPFEFPYATPESLSFVPLNPHVSIQSGSSTQHGVTPIKRTQYKKSVKYIYSFFSNKKENLLLQVLLC